MCTCGVGQCQGPNGVSVPLTDIEADKLRHLANGRDVLHIGHGNLRATLVMADTATSVLRIDVQTTGLMLRHIRDWDRDGKIGVIVSLFETFLPLLDVAYFDLVLLDGSVEADATAEALSLLTVGLRRDAVVAVTRYKPTQLQYAASAAAVDRWVIKTRRSLQVFDWLAVITPAAV